MSTDKFEKIQNPYSAGNPVKSAEMFFGREENFKRVEEWVLHDGPHVILLIGERRSGKTSILKQIEGGHLQHAGAAVFCNFQAMAARIHQDDDFPREIAEAILETPTFYTLREQFLGENTTESWTARLIQLFTQCLELAPSNRMIMLCDEFESIEELFKEGILSKKAWYWVKPILTQPVYFVMTSSHGFEDETVTDLLDVVSQQMPVHELEKRDALALIQNPVKGVVTYEESALQLIYRLAGGHPFYTQFICQNLISHINAETRRNSITPDDVEQVIKFIIKNPAGHLQEMWRDPVRRKQQSPQREQLINQIRHTLAALAHTLAVPADYADAGDILQTAQNKRFKIKEQSELFRTLGWLYKNTRLVERNNEEAYRFRHELFRRWLLHEIQYGEEIEDEAIPASGQHKDEINLLENEARAFSHRLKILLQDGPILLAEREELDEIAATEGLSSTQAEKYEQRLRRQWHKLPWSWIEEYRESCRALQTIHGKHIPD
ncbi:ATP-binding protein, partial [Candidatus Venteria ishoeyi]|uniref:ATP-binding protein n=1 Tax=Candidatus Venteria ishoeyi TaxID=1899563 RepID=UPI0015AD29FE